MIGREAYDSPEEHLHEMTGMSLEEAAVFLSQHDNDPNVAAEAYFLALEEKEQNANINPSNQTNSVDHLFQNTPKGEASISSNNFNPLFGSGRRLHEKSHPVNDTTNLEADVIRTLHVAFFKDAIIFFETPKQNTNKIRRRGVHTSSSYNTPYENRPDISSWIGNNVETGRVQDTNKELYESVLADMNNNKVPKLPWLKNNTGDESTRMQFSFILHDLREFASPPILPSSTANNSSFLGTGNKLGGSGNNRESDNRGRTPKRYAPPSNGVNQRDSSKKRLFKNEKLICFSFVGGFGILFPLFFSYILNFNVNLFYSLVGGIFGHMMFHGLQIIMKPSVIPLEFTVLDENKEKTMLKFSFGRYTWTNEFNHDHTIKQLYLNVVESMFGSNHPQYRTFYEAITVRNEGNEMKKELILCLKTGFGQGKKLLDPIVDGSKTLKNEKLLMQRIEVELLINVENEMKEDIRRRINNIKKKKM
jgi:hypothetical protein